MNKLDLLSELIKAYNEQEKFITKKCDLLDELFPESFNIYDGMSYGFVRFLDNTLIRDYIFSDSDTPEKNLELVHWFLYESPVKLNVEGIDYELNVNEDEDIKTFIELLFV